MMLEYAREAALEDPHAASDIAIAYLTGALSDEGLADLLPKGLSRESLQASRDVYEYALTESIQLLADECDGVADADALEEINDRFGVDPFDSR